MKLVIVGGHLSPALAVINALPKDTEILFLGRKHTFEGDQALSLEYSAIRSLGIPFESISTGRLQRRFTKYTITSLLKTPYGFIQSFFILKKFKPDVVLSFGGYLSIPVDLSAFFLRIPVVIHEQTLQAGLSNRITAPFANKICISWESSRSFFPKDKTVLTGNPIRKFQISQRLFNPCHAELVSVSSLRSRNKFGMTGRDRTLPIIYITGGSSGSHFINALVEGCIKELLEKFIIIHQTGDSKVYKDFDRLNDMRNSLEPKLKDKYILKKFVDDKELGWIYRKSTLTVSRAGINTICELIYFGKPAILIPIAFMKNSEQLKNSFFFKKLGLGEVLEQKYLNQDVFLQKLTDMLYDIKKYKRNKDRLTGLVTEDSAGKIVKIVKYAEKKKKVVY